MKAKLLISVLAAATISAATIGPASAGESRNGASQAVDPAPNAVGNSWVDTQQRGRGGRRGGPDAVLFSNPDFQGERFVIDGDYLPDLANSGFNDRAQSLRVERGYWIFCSDAQFRGQCRTFGPGRYPRLGWSLDNKVSSGRRISERYPYGGQPNWGGDRR